eukprot:TRINITY_DN6425_c0_g1_i1.p1 TRINITY_DN6425_c0_g1~~TRINITY_DN6425_c0_g1_i1.p1  ORF type:complete len:786 (-),score=239.66 TRINITY_DN6425_c0_g1_i1:69-2315(-)
MEKINNFKMKQMEESQTQEESTPKETLKKGLTFFDVEWPLNPNDIQTILDNISKGGVIKKDIATKIIEESKKLFKEEDLMLKLHLPKDGKFHIVGDLHGQLDDLLTVLEITGLPSLKNSILFNGDIVDRGQQSVECLLLILSFKLMFPKNIFINRGNHEIGRINKRYGFQTSFLERYSHDMYKEVQSLFNALPLCALIEDKKCFVVHGGPCVETLNIEDINHFKYDRAHEPIWNESTEMKIFEQLLWNDPRDEDGWSRSTRGCGREFGPDVTKKFIEANGLSYIIRSHELIQEGYQKRHNGHLYTLFSASRYCGENANKGAVATLSKWSSKPKFETFESKSFTNKNITEKREIFKKRKKEILKQLKERIVLNRYILAKDFEDHNMKDKDGFIKMKKWISVMGKVMKMDLDWISIQPYLCDAEKGFVNWRSFLDRYQMNIKSSEYKKWVVGVARVISGKLFENFENIKDSFLMMDSNFDGQISIQEFSESLKKLNIGLTDNQIYDFISSTDDDKDGFISYAEFVKRFSFDLGDEFSSENLFILLRELRYQFTTISKIFKNMDKNKDGYIDFKEFQLALTECGLKLDTEQSKKVFSYLDNKNEKKISFQQFSERMEVIDKKEDVWATQLLSHIRTILLSSKYKLLSIFQLLDTDGSGALDSQEFSLAIKILMEASKQGEFITELQIHKLFEIFDKDGNGEIDSTEFINGLKVTDKKKKKKRMKITKINKTGLPEEVLKDKKVENDIEEEN